MATAGLNSGPNTAVDLLRNAMMHNSVKAREEDHDHLGSPSPTPSGVETPKPDPKDKRLPGISPSYFGQVGASQSKLPPSSSSFPSSTPAPPPTTTAMPAGAPRPSAPLSPASSDSEDVPPTLPHERVHLSPFRPTSALAQEPHHSYPTPPLSSSSSAQYPFKNDADTSPDVVVDALRATSGDGLMDTVSGELASVMRKHTLTSPPPASCVVTKPEIHAPHMSNPRAESSPHSTIFPSIFTSPSCSSPPPAETHEGLTSPATHQSTPRTPRSLSTNSRPSRTSSPPTRPATTSKPPVHIQPTSSSRRDATAGALVGELKGRLSVFISEGRALKPSRSPYVVCQFQSNEYISKGPQDEENSQNSGTDTPTGGLPIQRSDSETGRPMAIPMKSRQSSHTGVSSRNSSHDKDITEPVWNHEATFDVVGDQSEIDISVYDHAHGESFLGHVRFSPSITDDDNEVEEWFKLESRDGADETVSGQIHLRIRFQGTEKKHYGPDDFAILKLIGKGTFGQVFQVRKRDTQRIYAMKVLSKKVIVQKKEVQHTIGERNILVRTAMTHSPFIVGLKFSFQTPTDLYLVTDYMSGGELFWHLQKEGRFEEQRAKFYIAELILALQHLHQHDIVYRDLKPENILLDANGHIALCDFGLSKANLTKDDTTNTFCGTTEYLAPEVLLDEAGYTKMVDFWSLGVLVFEMCCGWSPFYAEDTQQMYKNIAFGKVRFPRDALSNEGRNFVKGLLNRNPKHRLGALNDAEELKAHPFFNDIDWDALARKNLVPPFKPRLKSELDTSNFDPEFTNALNGASSLNARAAALASGIDTAATPLSPTVQANFKGFTFVDESNLEKNLRKTDDDGDDVMDEDEEDDEDGDDDVPGWEYDPQVNRMSGITRTTSGGRDADEGMFSGEGFEA